MKLDIVNKPNVGYIVLTFDYLNEVMFCRGVTFEYKSKLIHSGTKFKRYFNIISWIEKGLERVEKVNSDVWIIYGSCLAGC